VKSFQISEKLPPLLQGLKQSVINRDKKRLRYLATFPDGLGKFRVVAIADWLTQQSLVVFHNILMKQLKSIKTDYTFDQDKSISTIKKWTIEGKRLYRYDLSAATDRLPVVLQALVLNQYFEDPEMIQK